MMNYNTEQQKLSVYTRKFSENIYSLTIALKVEEIISKFAMEINKSAYSDFLAYIQMQSTEQILLSLSKIYDTDSNSISIHSIINYIESNRKKLPILAMSQDKSEFLDFNFEKYKEQESEKTENGYTTKTRLNHQLIPALIKSLKETNKVVNDSLKRELKLIKMVRDKQIAHTDKKVSSIPSATWVDIDKLVVFPKNILALVEDVFLATDTQFTQREYLSLFSMLKDLHVIDEKLKYVDVF